MKKKKVFWGFFFGSLQLFAIVIEEALCILTNNAYIVCEVGRLSKQNKIITFGLHMNGIAALFIISGVNTCLRSL